MPLGAAKTARESVRSPDDPAAICRALFYAAPTPTGFAEIVGGYFPVLHFRSGEIHIFDSSGNVERVIPFTETD
jgi:hypothetical protein